MSEQTEPHVDGNDWRIFATSPQGTNPERHTDIALMNLLSTHVGQLNSVRQAIWARFTAFLLGNSILFGFAGGANRPAIQQVTGTIAGIFLCIIWYLMLLRDQKFFLFLIERAARFKLPALPAEEANPANIFLTRESLRFGNVIYRQAFMVVWIFFVLHLIVLYPTIEGGIKEGMAYARDSRCYFMKCQ